MSFLCLSQFQMGTSPRATPLGLAKKTCQEGRYLIFESCPGAANSTRAGIMWEMKLKLQEKSVDQIFTGGKKNKQNF